MKNEDKVLLVLLILASFTIDFVRSEFKLHLLHTNDMHARFQETNQELKVCQEGEKCFGGFARLKTAVDKIRKEAKEKGAQSIFLVAGDTFHGSVLYTLFKGSVASELQNMLDVDAMALGNHEFDDGPEGLVPFIENSSSPVVCANLDYTQEPAFRHKSKIKQLTPSVVLDLSGVKVGVIGYLTPDTKKVSKVGKVTILDEITEIRKEAARLKSEGVKILIALGHSGFTKDKEIAEQVADLDVVVGGHTNTFLYNGAPPSKEVPEGAYPTVITQPSGRKVYVVQAYAFTKYLGNLWLTFDDNGEVLHADGNPILLDETFEKNDTVDREIVWYQDEARAILDKEVGLSNTFLEADDSTCRIRECNFGNLLTDAIVEYNARNFSGNGWTDAPIALIAAGGLKASINTTESNGIIKYSHLLAAFPYMNNIHRLTVNGSVLKEALENSVSHYFENAERFLQVSGVQVLFDVSKPPLQRVVSVKVRCGACPVPKYSLLIDDQDYNILTTTYLTVGGLGFSMFKNNKDRIPLMFSELQATLLYLSQRYKVHPELSGRIQFVKEPTSSSLKIESSVNSKPASKDDVYTLTASNETLNIQKPVSRRKRRQIIFSPSV